MEVFEQAVADLVAADVRSPRSEAELLAAHILGVSPNELTAVDVFPADRIVEFRELVARRAKRVPSAHLVGTVRIGPIEIAVGPGVYVPQIGTELTLKWAVQWLAAQTRGRTVVDLCTGSGVVALAIANFRPDAVVYGVELNPAAMAWAQRNAAERAAAGDTPITLHSGDVTDPGLLPQLTSAVDLVVSSPPYVPDSDEGDLDPEVANHDPHLALYGGVDGLSVIRPMAANIRRLLRPGGAMVMEHDFTHSQELGVLLRDLGFDEVVEHLDHASQRHFMTAVLPA